MKSTYRKGAICALVFCAVPLALGLTAFQSGSVQSSAVGSSVSVTSSAGSSLSVASSAGSSGSSSASATSSGASSSASATSADEYPDYGAYYPGYEEIQNRYSKFAQQTEDYAPVVVTLNDGTQVQRTPTSSGSYNNYFLNADNRGCKSCHASLVDLLDNMGMWHFCIMKNTYGGDITVSQCKACHGNNNYINDPQGLASMMHGIHTASRGFTGDCMSCHDGSIEDGTLALWDEVKYNRLWGIVDVPDVDGDFTYDQDTVVANEDSYALIGYYHINDLFRIASFDAGVTSTTDIPAGWPAFDDWKFSVSGLVDNPFTMTLSELIDKFQSETTTMTMNCTINPIGGGLLTNAVIKGIPLDDILEYAGVQDDAACMELLSSEGMHEYVWFDQLKYKSYLVYEINGQRLDMLQGYPLQIWVGGMTGDFYIKHLSEIKILDNCEPDYNQYQGLKLGWDQYNDVALEDVEGAGRQYNKPNIGFFKTVEGQIIKVGEAYSFQGYADAYNEDIVKIEFSMDRGATWTAYDTSDTTGDKWVYWHYTFTPEEAGAYVIMARATTRSGLVTYEPVTMMVNAE